ncbi:DNA internalization-related competence protein ComEC/Rec2 [Filobacillus milosensis]|uniref:DNA internalization-related competence protein ComEC/Rec2 n=1 Tax=Filobacillus milosensis TaxID=94137 RepID=A0A4Y8IWR5_9BACI|nr:DNA internalization-related competence protein ComEC/Rec2 [Filobacillus milosensis]TFB24865.1 DNA internalization-related competence protein ComEC/Rec2 [Filobacillus milosensis]
MKSHWYLISLSLILGYLPKVIGFLSFIIFLILFRRKIIKNRLLLVLSSLTFFLPGYIIPSTFETPDIENDFITGWIEIQTHPEIKNDSIRFIGEYQGQRIYFYADSPKSPLKQGAQCYVEAEIQQPKQPTNPGSFDYRKYLASLGVSWVSYDNSFSKCANPSYLSHLYDWRDHLMSITESKFSEATVVWIKALIFGDRSDIEPELIDTFEYWGLSHLLAISGLHVGMFLSVIYFLLMKVCRLTKEQSKCIIIMIIPFYIIISGSQPPVIRAGLMAICLIVFSMFKKNTTDTIDIISIVMICMLLYNPFLLHQMAFQFSFAVTFALILSKNLLFKDHWIMISIKVSLISQLVLLPLQFYYFYYTNVMSFLFNLIYVPYFTLIAMPLLLLLMLSLVLPQPVRHVLEFLFNFINTFFIQLLQMVGEPMRSIWVIGKPHLMVVLLYFIFFILMMLFWEKGQLKKAALLGIIIIMVCYGETAIKHFTPEYSVTMLDVGQAESIIIELPYRQGIFMVDAGEEMNGEEETNYNFNHVIKPYLWSKGITEIDSLWISHFDRDHSGAMEQVIKQFEPKQLYTAPIERYYKYPGLDHIIVHEGTIVNYGDITFNVLSPTKSNKHTDANDQSIVFLLQYKQHKMLFTGDISKEVEQELVSKNSIGDIDVLKIAHHGSQTSTSKLWLQKAKPEAAIVSVGENNFYGHPHPIVIQRLKDFGINVYRSDQLGAVTLKYKDGQSTFYHYNP